MIKATSYNNTNIIDSYLTAIISAAPTWSADYVTPSLRPRSCTFFFIGVSSTLTHQLSTLSSTFPWQLRWTFIGTGIGTKGRSDSSLPLGHGLCPMLSYPEARLWSYKIPIAYNYIFTIKYNLWNEISYFKTTCFSCSTFPNEHVAYVKYCYACAVWVILLFGKCRYDVQDV